MSAERKSVVVREIHDYPIMLQACHVMEITGFSHGKAYQLMRSSDCPKFEHGKRIVIPRDRFWAYLTGEMANGGVAHE